jgi:sulfotransferase family protein
MGAIVWLASYPKSGNTWMRSFLHNFLRNPDRSYDINKMSDFTLGDSLVSWYQQFDPRPGSHYSKEDVQKLRPQVHRAMTRAYPDSVFVKTHNALMDDGGAPLVTLEVTAGAIYIVRNPLDVVLSYADHIGQSIDRTIEAMNLRGASTENDDVNVYECYGTWSEHVKSWTQTPSRTLHVVRYEDLLEAPLKTFGAVARFLGIDPPRARLEKAIKLSSFRVLKEQEKRHGFIERSKFSQAFFREGKAGQWRGQLTKEQVARLVHDHREQMARFGYVPEGY